MSLTPLAGAHPALEPLRPGLRCYELRDERGVYAAVALGEHPDCLELHLELLRFGPRTVRSMRKDLEELKALALGLGKSRIIGIKAEAGEEPDRRWPKFTRLFGFTGQRLLQLAELRLD